MGLFEELKEATQVAQREDDLPDHLAARLIAIADRPEHYQPFAEDLAKLVAQVRLYDTYGQTGYIGMGVDSCILERAIVRLEKKAEAGKR